jgi:hypothetical protein
MWNRRLREAEITSVTDGGRGSGGFVTGFSSRRSRLALRPDLRFSRVSIIQPLLRIHSCSSGGMDTGLISGPIPHRRSLPHGRKRGADDEPG